MSLLPSPLLLAIVPSAINLNVEHIYKYIYLFVYIFFYKENSDWTAFAEALVSDVKQKQEKIQVLEAVVELPAKNFLKDPSETQKRFNKAYDSFKATEDQKRAEIKKRMDLIEVQTKELQRLHGLMVVEERGKILRKIGH